LTTALTLRAIPGCAIVDEGYGQSF